MKKLFIILILMYCGFLYAETKTFRVEDYIEFAFERPVELVLSSGFYSKRINAIIPYNQDYIMKWSDKNLLLSEIYIHKGFVFFTCLKEYNETYRKDIYTYYECRITDIKPNEFTVDMKELTKD